MTQDLSACLSAASITSQTSDWSVAEINNPVGLVFSLN